jgi:hypothetical protein
LLEIAPDQLEQQRSTLDEITEELLARDARQHISE